MLSNATRSFNFAVSLKQCLSVIACCLVLSNCSPKAALRTPSDDLSVMTFNIRYGTADDGSNRWDARKGMLMQLLHDQDCDIIGMQEALHFQLEEIVSSLPRYACTGVGRDDGSEAGEYAAILFRKDRFRMDDSGTFWFSDTPNNPGSKSWGNNVTRICTWAKLVDRSTNKPVFVYNVHLDHESQRSRERSTRLLLDSIASRVADGPVVLTGDFNAGETNAAIRTLLDSSGAKIGRRFIDTFSQLRPSETNIGTYHAFTGRAETDKIDFIIVSSGIGVTSSDILRFNQDGRYPSDHFPVTATLNMH
jgi:endonuclease/exonuclease/phosphatase family metal-dependent hydrolase